MSLASDALCGLLLDLLLLYIPSVPSVFSVMSYACLSSTILKDLSTSHWFPVISCCLLSSVMSCGRFPSVGSVSKVSSRVSFCMSFSQVSVISYRMPSVKPFCPSSSVLLMVRSCFWFSVVMSRSLGSSVTSCFSCTSELLLKKANDQHLKEKGRKLLPGYCLHHILFKL